MQTRNDIAMEDPGPPPRHGGKSYRRVLADLHGLLRPKSYLEIGVNTGETLALAACPTIGVDPQPQIRAPEVMERLNRLPALMLFATTSDDFFATRDPSALLGRPVDLAFLDGMHLAEFLLRDFINTERHCRPNSVIALHDCLPLHPGMATRLQAEASSPWPSRRGWWTGDVWRTALLLKRRRRGLRILALDAEPTGLLLVTNLDPGDRSLAADYAGCVEEMHSWSLEAMGTAALFDELGIRPTASIEGRAALAAHAWL